MPLITSKFGGSCKGCGNYISAGSKVGWEPTKKGIWCDVCISRGVAPSEATRQPTQTPTSSRPPDAPFTIKRKKPVATTPPPTPTPPPPASPVPSGPYHVVGWVRSRSDFTKYYEIRESHTTGITYCECPKWKYNNGSCHHMDSYEAGDYFTIKPLVLRGQSAPPFDDPTVKARRQAANAPPTSSRYQRAQDILDQIRKAAARPAPPPKPVQPVVCTVCMGKGSPGGCWACSKIGPCPECNDQGTYGGCDTCGKTKAYVPPAYRTPDAALKHEKASWFDVMNTFENALITDLMSRKDGPSQELSDKFEKYKKVKAHALTPGSENEGKIGLRRALLIMKECIELALA